MTKYLHVYFLLTVLPDFVHLDVMDEPSIQAAIKYALEKYQKIVVLVNFIRGLLPARLFFKIIAKNTLG
jgi:hypothetical protein